MELKTENEGIENVALDFLLTLKNYAVENRDISYTHICLISWNEKLLKCKYLKLDSKRTQIKIQTIETIFPSPLICIPLLFVRLASQES